MHAKRSHSNYRIYDEEALEDLKFIEECKKNHLPLYEIKQKMELKRNKKQSEKADIEKQMETVTNQMKQLKKDLSLLLPIISVYKKDPLSKELNEEGTALIQSLLKITS